MGIARFTRKQVEVLVQFGSELNKEKFFLAKDQGLYLGITNGSHEKGDFSNCIQYAKGCDPKLNSDDWYETARSIAGGDDFGEHLDIDILVSVLRDKNWTQFNVRITANELQFLVK